MLIIVACGAWVLLYFRAYVSWTLWVLLTHGLTYFAILFVSAFIPGLSRFFGPARGPRESIQDHSKRWYAYMTSLDTILYGFMLYAGLSVFDFLAGGIFDMELLQNAMFSFSKLLFSGLADLLCGHNHVGTNSACRPRDSGCF